MNRYGKVSESQSLCSTIGIDPKLPVYLQPQSFGPIHGAVLGIPLFLALVGVSFALEKMGMPGPSLGIVCTSAVAIVFLVMGLTHYRRSKLRDRVKRSRWMLCERCLYDLHATESPGVCPECGTEFAAHDLVKKWRRVLDQPDFGEAALASIEPQLVDPDVLDTLRRTSPEIPKAGLREPFRVWPEALAAVPAARAAATARLGRPARLTRAILFDKAPGRNWTIEVHQDTTVALAMKDETAKRFGPWSNKDGAWHAEAPDSLLRQMATVRLHLDDANEDNGCLLVVPMDSEWHPKKLDHKELQRLSKQAKPLVVKAGDAVIMSPLTPHASGRNTTDRHRRVLHMEFAAEEPGGGLRWRDEAEILGRQSSSMS